MKQGKFYSSKIAENGQVVIPKEIRDTLHLKGGEKILISIAYLGHGLPSIILRKPTLSFSSLVGIFSPLKGRTIKKILRHLDDEEMK